MLFTPYSPPADPRQTPHQRRKASRFALLLFALTAAAGLLVKYVGQPAVGEKLQLARLKCWPSPCGGPFRPGADPAYRYYALVVEDYRKQS